MKSLFSIFLIFVANSPVLGADSCQSIFTNFNIIQYGNIKFEIPILSNTGYVLRAEQTEIPREIKQRIEIQGMKDKWNFNHLLEPHKPVKIGSVENRQAFSKDGVVSVLDMPIKFPGTDYIIPDDLVQFRETIQKIINFEHSANPKAMRHYFAYLTVHQSWVEPGNYQRRPGMHVDGFQGIERPDKEEIEHSYLVFNDVPTVFTNQRYQLNNFDFSKYNLFSELDRQTAPEFEYEATPYDIFFADAYTVHRANQATKKVLRTFIRLTYSVAIFDRLGLTDNPLFPYRWERLEKRLQEKFEKYVPPIGMDKLQSMASISEVPGKRIGVIGIGEGSDGLQAAQIASMLKQSGKDIGFVASFRTPKKLIKAKKIKAGLYKVDHETRMEGRLFEDVYSDEYSSYLVFDNLENEQLENNLRILARKHQIDGFVFVDGGGNVLSPIFLQDTMLNDHRTLLAAEKIHEVADKTMIIVCPGINTPTDSHAILANLNAKRYRPSPNERSLILNNFKKWNMAYPSPRTFAFIPMIWQQALLGEFGDQNFPTLYPGDPKYPVTPENQDLMVVSYDSLMKTIGGK